MRLQKSKLTMMNQSIDQSINQSTYPIQSMDRSIDKLQLNLPQ